MLTRLKLKQAYGRLIRRAGDTGVFVLLDKAMPSRLFGAFPEGKGRRSAPLAIPEGSFYGDTFPSRVDEAVGPGLSLIGANPRLGHTALTEKSLRQRKKTPRRLECLL